MKKRVGSLLFNHVKKLGIDQGFGFDHYQELGRLVVEKVGNRIEELHKDLVVEGRGGGLMLPVGKKQQAEFFLKVAKQMSGTTNNPLIFYAGSCPDYSFDERTGKYTHEFLGGGVPLLTRLHLDAFEGVARVLSAHGVAFEYRVKVADVEARDEVFANRYTSGSQDEFLALCQSSVRATRAEIVNRFGNDQRFVSTSFFGEFGENVFMARQNHYQRKLECLSDEDGRFRARVTSETLARLGLYRHMYPESDVDFLERRTMRTMAQYLALAELVRERSGIVINHSTINRGLFNDNGLLDESVFGVLPVFRLERQVY